MMSNLRPGTETGRWGYGTLAHHASMQQPVSIVPAVRSLRSVQNVIGQSMQLIADRLPRINRRKDRQVVLRRPLRATAIETDEHLFRSLV
jgi:hypothetical protein